MTIQADQAATCARFGVAPVPCRPDEKVGIALQTAGRLPLNALRHTPEGDTCGWYLWWGESLGAEADFFQPLHAAHLPEHCPEILPYLSLPPGWRVLLAPGHEDAWYDRELVAEER
jgi:hypothetical protein